jgi:predicted ATPase
LVLLTCRPHFHPAWHHRSYLTEITVNRLPHAQVEQIVNRLTDGKALPTEVLAQIVEKTDGVPLFVEEMTKTILESGQLKAVDEHYELIGSFSTFAIPATLQDSLMARLDRLVTAKAVAQYAAVIGRQFSYELLQALLHVDAVTLQHELGRLVEAEIVYQRGVPPQATYVFKHALIQDAASQSLLKSTRQQYHQRIAQVLASQFPVIAEMQPELIAYHCTEASLIEQAIGYWQKAGQRASERSAHVEAISHLNKGLELLQTLPEIPQHLQQELDMHITLGKELIGMKGYAAPEVQQVYSHALTLCQTVEKPLQTYQVLRGLASYYLIRGELQTTLTLRQQLLQMAQQQQDPAMLRDAHEGMGFAHHYLGQFLLARSHYDQSMALCDPQDGRFRHSLSAQNHVVTCQSHAAQNLWYLGYPDQALHTQRAALVLAQDIAHPLTLAHTLCYAAFRHQRRREVVQVRDYAEAVMSLALEHGMALWEDYGIFLRGWALAMQGHEEEGLVQMRQGITDSNPAMTSLPPVCT